MSSIEYFLTYPLFDKGERESQKKSDQKVYDYEDIHYGLLKILLEKSPEFARQLLGTQLHPKNIKVTIQPERGSISNNSNLDLFVLADGQSYYVEIKTWAELKESQFDKQVQYIKSKNAKGCYILFPKRAEEWTEEGSKDIIRKRSDNCCRLISVEDLLTALNSVTTFSKPDADPESTKIIAEIIDAYKVVLKDVKERFLKG